jgi:hypothetical protein
MEYELLPANSAAFLSSNFTQGRFQAGNLTHRNASALNIPISPISHGNS